ncbi:hypothetical protein JCM15831A_11520 [Asaia astilbis]
MRGPSASAQNGFMSASAPEGPTRRTHARPGIQGVTTLCEVTGGGQKVFGVAIEYDTSIDPRSITPETFALSVVPAAKGFFPGMPQEPDKNASDQKASPRAVVATYTNATSTMRADARSVQGRFVIAEFARDPDLSLPTTDSDKIEVVQKFALRTDTGAAYPPSPKSWTNTEGKRTHVSIRGVDAWEQNHWWWDDERATYLEYSIFLPKSFLEPGGEKKAYPLLLAVTHSGTSPDGTCAQTLTEQCIATIWSLPENQAKHECVIVTPRYERTTMNDYWEHTNDVENTYRLVQSLIDGHWNFGNPNRADRKDKTLRIDRNRIYCTGWSMGGMTSLWLMAKHPDTFAGGLVIAGQERPADMISLAHQNVLIITGSEDDKATPWNEKCVPVWQKAGGKVTRPTELLDPATIFPIDQQQALSHKINDYLGQGGNITFLTFDGVDHLGSCRKFFYIEAARDWLFRQRKI